MSSDLAADGFAAEIRKRTSGAASPQLIFSGYVTELVALTKVALSDASGFSAIQIRNARSRSVLGSYD